MGGDELRINKSSKKSHFRLFPPPPPRAPPRPHKMAVGAVEIRPLEDDGEGGEKEGKK